MFTLLSAPTRRGLLVAAAAAGASSVLSATPGQASEGAGTDAIRPFHIDVSEDALVDLRRRIAMTRWPDKETVADESQGVPLATIQGLARYWRTDFDWRKVEAQLNALPQFQLKVLFAKRRAYAQMMGTRPQTLYGLADSPVALAAWLFDHGDGYGQPAAAITSAVLGRTVNGHSAGDLTRDNVLDDITLYWLTNTAVSAARFYWESHINLYNAADLSFPTAVSVFPGENYQAPRSWTERAYHKLIYFNEVDAGGHYAAWEQPRLFSEEVRALRRTNGAARSDRWQRPRGLRTRMQQLQCRARDPAFTEQSLRSNLRLSASGALRRATRRQGETCNRVAPAALSKRPPQRCFYCLSGR